MKLISGRTAAEIAGSVEQAIRTGRIGAGYKLPSVRDVADQLGVNRNTVMIAYSRLRDAGLITGAGRQGSLVAGVQPLDAYRPIIPADARDLASGNVDASLLPDLKTYLQDLEISSGGYEMVDDDQLFIEFGKQVLTSEGITARQIGVVSGAMDGIERALRAHVRSGDAIGVEDPGYVSVLLLVRALGLRPVPIAMDDDGITVEALGAALTAGIKALVITPRAQNPTGARLTAGRARALRDVLDAYPGVLLVEDDHAGGVSGAKRYTLAPRDAEKRPWTVIRSVSKFLGPDLRLALAAGDAMTIARLRDQQALGPRWVSHILQRLAFRMWSDPQTTRIIDNASKTYAGRRDKLISCLAGRGLTGYGASGLHVWVPVAREAEAVQGMLVRGWSIQAGEVFRLRSEPGVRIGIAGLKQGEEESVAAALAESLMPGRAVYS
ncbi:MULTISPECIES: aminotransferase class I/II-fold pyridoxal phosphate-dependent enzyme [unclassified Sphingobium]|uniref:aminotransferase class I/II-fold pyridoxal phosphate-dependent enzyme n=1 Tax=unclassified Sphingobium TaxID=2611147 RepID=UPI00214AD77A|nr:MULTISPECIES: aminotransferase class I/II-fold pyridoxal phosphate-dependent enzyme [unclassified Sphingobium]